ncbi:ArfGap-domain-containing protein [Myriangium duriaei CBS 260.36]|uniref:ADP-ribosylation factor GTPase-activating protein n=1 Tax=Myriangium duriaei CBS 260.36 TaxID=1168546 RepID=A0A9P4ITR5_9PEZI|nr:ArfGap-domain-containing protein [Myriangium duriaei CBS 260.36]
MGNVSSRQDEGAPLFLRDQQRFSISSLVVSNARGRTLLRVSPNSYPASRYVVRKDIGDDSPIDYVQDPDSNLSGGPPAFLLRLPSDEDLTLQFNCNIRQAAPSAAPTLDDPHGGATSSPSADTSIAGLTFVFASTAKEIDQLMTREFHADPNIHKNPNVSLVGDFTTGGSPVVQLSYLWKWKPPKIGEDAGGGWRTTCSFVEYDQRAHKLNALATFSIWVQNTARPPSSPQNRSPRLETISPPRLRVPSAQSIESRMSVVSDSDGDTACGLTVPQSPSIEPIPEYGLGLIPTVASSIGTSEKLDIGSISRPAEDYISTEDGPVFRATMKSLESKTGTMRSRMKRVLRTAEAAESAQVACNDAVLQFMDALRDASTSNANAVRPALEHYFEKIAKEILSYERQNALDLRRLIIDPITKLYNIDIKQAESKRRDFEEESKDYYAYVGKYLGQRTESLKEKKRAESDSKYQSKRRTFELKRFDYSSFMHDLHGGRKDLEVLSQLTKYADSQTKGYLNTAKRVEDMLPQLDALCFEVNQADKEFQMQRTEREEKRRALEKNPRASMFDPEAATQISAALASGAGVRPDGAAYGTSPPTTSHAQMGSMNGNMGAAPSDASAMPTRNTSNKFKGIRDLEDKDVSETSAASAPQIRKEGLLWSLSRPGVHIDPKGIKTAGWHKFWIVLDQGRLSEYVNWKDKLDLHMDPIDLRVASVREARNSERRFCFEVITPQYTRVYQAPSEEEMRAWIAAINNALQSAFESKTVASSNISTSSGSGSTRSTIAAVLTGKSTSLSGHRNHLPHGHHSKAIHRHATTGDKPAFMRTDSNDPNPSEVLMRIREADEGNRYCADCGSESKTEWVSINLGIVLCIECSGIHRSLGTHISKVRSLTLDVAVFTPDIVDLLLLIGNRVSNMIWEARLDRFLKPSPHSTREQRLHFITAKYSDRAYVEPDPAHSPDELLLTGIKRNQIQSVLHALALKANPNAQDRSRGTHAVYVALAAADPAMPASLTSTPHNRSPSSSTFPSTATLAPPGTGLSTSPTIPERPSTPVRKPFPVAELLLQNGADIPTMAAPIPLSVASRQYLDFKTEQRNGRLTPGPPGTSLGTSPGRGDGFDSGLSSHTPSPGQGRTYPPASSGGQGGIVAGSYRERELEDGGRKPTGLRKAAGWSNSGFVGGVKALGDVGRRS